MSRKATLELVIKREGVAVAEKALIQLGEVGEAVAKRFQGSMSATDKSVLQLAAQVQTLNNNVTKTGVSGAASFHAFRAPLMSVTKQFLELNPAVAQLSSLLGNFAVGAGWMIGILAGVAALAFAWDKVSASAKAAKKEQEDGKHVLEGVRDRNRNPVLGGLPSAITSETFHQQDLTSQRADLLSKLPVAVQHGWADALREQISGINREIGESKNLIQNGNKEVARLNKEHNDRVADENRQAADKDLAEWKAAFQRRIDAMKETEDTLTRIQREGAEARKRNAELNDFGVGFATQSVTQSNRSAAIASIGSLQIPTSVFDELSRVGARAKDGVERMAHAWEVLAGLAKEETDKAKSRGTRDVAVQSGLSLLSTFGGQKGQLVSGVASAAMQGFAAGGPWGAAIAGVTALTTGIFGMSKAAKEAAERIAAAQKEFQFSFALYKKGAYGTVTDTDRALEQARQQYAANEKSIQELYGGKKNESERERLLAENKRAYEAYLAQIRATAAEMDKAAKADGFRKSIEEFTRVIDNLQGFQNELKLGDLSPLSPMQKLAEARRQYEDVLGKARGGDITAADQIPQFARAFLEASRSVNASGIAYQRDFQRVQLDTDEIGKMFESQRALAQQQLDVLIGIRDGSAATAVKTHEELERIGDAIETLINETTRVRENGAREQDYAV